MRALVHLLVAPRSAVRVARVDLGANDYSLIGRLNGKPSAILAVYQLPGTNAVQTVAGIRKLMTRMKRSFPEDIDYAISLDQTLPVTEGMKEIFITLVIALVLVILVVYLFLQDWRSTLIPMLAVPVSLIGTFIFFPAFGFSINTLSLLGMVLAIGLVVDDAIVVVEGVQRHIEEGLCPKEAAQKAMDELSGPVVGVALVLASVFVPTAFIPGITGRLYQQFALTIAVSVMLSAFNALTLSPALAGLLLKPKPPAHERRGPIGKFFGAFNRYWDRATEGFVRWSDVVIRKGMLVFLLLAAMYESWRLPWAVLLGSPLVALGALFGVWLMGYDNNVYVQIGLVMLIGLAAKNAILIVEFAKAKHEEGISLEEAALTSARLRFRPILMTAFAFILGVVPLMRASGAGAGAQNVMGVGVFFGMLVATALGVFIIPGNYTFILGLGRRKGTKPVPAPAAQQRVLTDGPQSPAPPRTDPAIAGRAVQCASA